MDEKDLALPDAVDVVVLGTGLPECVLAAASARDGLSVLHLDRNEYYGGFWASFTFEQLQKWLKDQQNVNIESKEVELPSFNLMDGEIEYGVNDDHWDLVHNVIAQWHIADSVVCKPGEPSDPSAACTIGTEKQSNISRRYFEENSRLFNIDLAPKLIFASGKTTSTLIQSGVAQYMEFKSVDRVLTTYEEKLEKVPLSRSQVFQSKEIDPFDKRLLMRVLTLCWDYESRQDEWEGFKRQPADKFLDDRRLTSRVRHYLLNAIGMGYPGMTTEEFLCTMKKFMKSSGVFGCQTSFLWPLYGCGDLAQAFSRSCAVFGGIYCLRCPVQAWLALQESGNITAIVVNGKRVDCKYLVSSVEYIPQRLRQKLVLSDDESFCRAILLTDRSLMPDTKHHVSILNYSPAEGKQRVLLLEAGYSALVTPADVYIVYLWTSDPSAESECAIRSLIAKLFVMCDEELEPQVCGKPRVLWSLFYKQRCVKVADPLERSSCKNVIVTTPPSSEWDMDCIIEKAESQFSQWLPDVPFFMKRSLPTEECPQAQ